jgi:hypothetical protein
MTMTELVNLAYAINQKLACANKVLDLANLTAQGEQNTMVDPKVAAIVQQLDVATDAIAARIQKLIDAGLSPESEAALQAEVDKIASLGKDPENPVPPA